MRYNTFMRYRIGKARNLAPLARNTMTKARSIDAPAYLAGDQDDDAIIARALDILAARVNSGALFDGSMAVRQYLTVHAARHDGREVFSVFVS